MVNNSNSDSDTLPFQQLEVTRLRQNLTTENVAKALNLSLSTIHALEAGEFDKLHGEAFVTGYMRAYAKFLGLPETQTDAMINDFLTSTKQVSAVEKYQVPAMFNARISHWFQHKQYKTGYGLAAAISLVALLGFFSVNQEDRPQPAVASDDIHLQTETGTTVISSIQKLPRENPTQDILPQLTVSETAIVTNTDALGHTVAMNQQRGSSATSQLAFQFSADCWVQILDGDNEVIYSSLQRSKQELKLSGKPPFRITLGYAPGVSLSYNGEPVDLNAEKADLVKLVLGNS